MDRCLYHLPSDCSYVRFNRIKKTLKGVNRMHLQESGEMYLETILVLSRRLNKVRSVDVAEEMGYSKPSVSRAVGILKKNGYIIMDGSGHLYLTDEGRSVAEKNIRTSPRFNKSIHKARCFRRNCRRGCLQNRACYFR